MVAKWLQTLKELSPKLSRVAFISTQVRFGWGSSLPGSVRSRCAFIWDRATDDLVHTPTDVETTLLSISREPASGLIIPPDLFTIAHRELIIRLAAQNRIPTIYGLSLFATQGRSARFKTRPSFELVINLKSAYALGIIIPPMLLATADEVIE